MYTIPMMQMTVGSRRGWLNHQAIEAVWRSVLRAEQDKNPEKDRENRGGPRFGVGVAPTPPVDPRAGLPCLRVTWFAEKEQGSKGAGEQEGKQAGVQGSAGAGEQGREDVCPTDKVVAGLPTEPPGAARSGDRPQPKAFSPAPPHPCPPASSSLPPAPPQDLYAVDRDELLRRLLRRKKSTGGFTSPARRDDSTGRSCKMTVETRDFVVRALELGFSRNEAAKELGICRATITKLVRRDEAFAKQVAKAEKAGEELRKNLDSVWARAVIEPHPVVSTPAFELQKQYLISRGLPAAWVRRLRLRTPEEFSKWWHAVFAAEKRENAIEKAVARVEKFLEEERAYRPKVKQTTTITRRHSFNKRGQPVEKVRTVVETRPIIENERLFDTRRLLKAGKGMELLARL